MYLRIGEEVITWPCYFFYNKGKVVIGNETILQWVQTVTFLYLLLIILFIGWIIWRKKNGNGIIPIPKKENIWRWVKWLRDKLNLNGEK